jgi:hypothetical protein
MKIRRIGVLSLGKMFAVIYGGLGLLVGLGLAVFSLVGGALLANQQGANAGLPAAFTGIAAVIVLPILYGLAGFIGGIITAALFNFGARLTGGLEIETVQ